MTSEFQRLSVHLTDAAPCPFCGSTRIVKGERYYAMCVDCGATGPERNADATERKFTGDWNSRNTDTLRVAVNASCTCGGLPDTDPKACPACMVWHRITRK